MKTWFWSYLLISFSSMGAALSSEIRPEVKYFFLDQLMINEADLNEWSLTDGDPLLKYTNESKRLAYSKTKLAPLAPLSTDEILWLYEGERATHRWEDKTDVIDFSDFVAELARKDSKLRPIVEADEREFIRVTEGLLESSEDLELLSRIAWRVPEFIASHPIIRQKLFDYFSVTSSENAAWALAKSAKYNPYLKIEFLKSIPPLMLPSQEARVRIELGDTRWEEFLNDRDFRFRSQTLLELAPKLENDSKLIERVLNILESEESTEMVTAAWTLMPLAPQFPQVTEGLLKIVEGSGKSDTPLVARALAPQVAQNPKLAPRLLALLENPNATLFQVKAATVALREVVGGDPEVQRALENKILEGRFELAGIIEQFIRSNPEIRAKIVSAYRQEKDESRTYHLMKVLFLFADLDIEARDILLEAFGNSEADSHGVNIARALRAEMKKNGKARKILLYFWEEMASKEDVWISLLRELAPLDKECDNIRDYFTKHHRRFYPDHEASFMYICPSHDKKSRFEILRIAVHEGPDAALTAALKEKHRFNNDLPLNVLDVLMTMMGNQAFDLNSSLRKSSSKEDVGQEALQLAYPERNSWNSFSEAEKDTIAKNLLTEILAVPPATLSDRQFIFLARMLFSKAAPGSSLAQTQLLMVPVFLEDTGKLSLDRLELLFPFVHDYKPDPGLRESFERIRLVNFRKLPLATTIALLNRNTAEVQDWISFDDAGRLEELIQYLKENISDRSLLSWGLWTLGEKYGNLSEHEQLDLTKLILSIDLKAWIPVATSDEIISIGKPLKALAKDSGLPLQEDQKRRLAILFQKAKNRYEEVRR